MARTRAAAATAAVLLLAACGGGSWRDNANVVTADDVDPWPLTIDAVELDCIRGGAVANNPEVEPNAWALNGTARSLELGADVSTITRDGADVHALLERALDLCD